MSWFACPPCAVADLVSKPGQRVSPFLCERSCMSVILLVVALRPFILHNTFPFRSIRYLSEHLSLSVGCGPLVAMSATSESATVGAPTTDETVFVGRPRFRCLLMSRFYFCVIHLIFPRCLSFSQPLVIGL